MEAQKTEKKSNSNEQMSKEQLRKEFIKTNNGNRWKRPMTESLGRLFDVYYSKRQVQDTGLSNRLLKSRTEDIAELKAFIIWMTGHKYFVKQRDKLLK